MAMTDDTNSAAQTGSMESAMNMAAEIFAAAQGSVPSPQSAEKTEDKTDPPSREALASMLMGMLSDRKPDDSTASPAGAPAPQPGSPTSPSGLGSAAAVLPMLMQAFSGGENFIKPEKLNLIKAFKPYMTESSGSSIDRAIKMANIAQAAKSALAALGR